MARSERAGLQSLGENVGSGKAAPPPAVRKPVAFRQATEPEELNLKRSGRAEPFRTVSAGLWADPVVTRKFHVASRRINNLRELSGERAAEPLPEPTFSH